MTAGYVNLAREGLLKQRAVQARNLLDPCQLCPRKCNAARISDETGSCGIGSQAVVASYHAHFGEEPELVGHFGSGTVFFSGCNLRCVFCQNYDISHLGSGRLVSASQLASIFLRVQNLGCHNLNLVSPSHVIPQILEALEMAVNKGLSLPIVYNTGGYDRIHLLQLLDGVVDIYMPDVKSFAADFCQEYLHAPDYPGVIQSALQEMARQVGDFQEDEAGIAQRGVLVRHLVMPEREEDSREILRFFAEMISVRLRVNIMEQYRPMYLSKQYPELDHRTSLETCRRVRKFGEELGLHLCR